nr:DUF58 domain-containing protein [bacterium]
MPVTDAAFLAKLQALSLCLQQDVRMGGEGARKSRARGSSVEFADYREYVPGDDLRRMDWAAYARFEKLFIRVYRDERDLLVTLLMDNSASMAFGQPAKWQRTKELAAVLGYVALHKSDRCRTLSLADDAPPRLFAGGKSGYLPLAEHLEGMQAGGISRLRQRAMRLAAGGGMTVIFSDLWMPPEEWQACVEYLQYTHQEVALVHLLSGEELQPDLAGRWRLTDAETGATRDMHLTSDALDAYQKALSAHLEGVAAYCRGRGVPYCMVDCRQPLERIVFGPLAGLGILR